MAVLQQAEVALLGPAGQAELAAAEQQDDAEQQHPDPEAGGQGGRVQAGAEGHRQGDQEQPDGDDPGADAQRGGQGAVLQAALGQPGQLDRGRGLGRVAHRLPGPDGQRHPPPRLRVQPGLGPAHPLGGPAATKVVKLNLRSWMRRSSTRRPNSSAQRSAAITAVDTGSSLTRVVGKWWRSHMRHWRMACWWEAIRSMLSRPGRLGWTSRVWLTSISNRSTTRNRWAAIA